VIFDPMLRHTCSLPAVTELLPLLPVSCGQVQLDILVLCDCFNKVGETDFSKNSASYGIALARCTIDLLLA
jgi:hypothetical protein